MTWKDILKLDIEGYKRSYPSLKRLPDDAIREFDRRMNDPMTNANRLIAELKQKYGVGQRPAVGRLVKQDKHSVLDVMQDRVAGLGDKYKKFEKKYEPKIDPNYGGIRYRGGYDLYDEEGIEVQFDTIERFLRSNKIDYPDGMEDIREFKLDREDLEKLIPELISEMEEAIESGKIKPIDYGVDYGGEPEDAKYYDGEHLRFY